MESTFKLPRGMYNSKGMGSQGEMSNRQESTTHKGINKNSFYKLVNKKMLLKTNV